MKKEKIIAVIYHYPTVPDAPVDLVEAGMPARSIRAVFPDTVFHPVVEDILERR